MQYQHLIGLAWDPETEHCFTLLRRFYQDVYGITLTDYANPTEWWRDGQMDLYAQLAEGEGFEIVHAHPRDWLPGDVIIMAINAPVGNHCAVLLDNGKILHHLVGQLSTETDYGGLFRNTTVGVYRHRDVPKQKPPETLVDVREYLSPAVRRRVEELQRRRETVAADVGGTGDA